MGQLWNPQCACKKHAAVGETLVSKLNALTGCNQTRLGVPFTDIQALVTNDCFLS
jgi:hypothetical protein